MNNQKNTIKTFFFILVFCALYVVGRYVDQMEPIVSFFCTVVAYLVVSNAGGLYLTRYYVVAIVFHLILLMFTLSHAGFTNNLQYISTFAWIGYVYALILLLGGLAIVIFRKNETVT